MIPLIELYLSICPCVFLRKHHVRVPVSVRRPTQVCVNTIEHRHTRTEHNRRQPEAARGAGVRFYIPNKAN